MSAIPMRPAPHGAEFSARPRNFPHAASAFIKWFADISLSDVPIVGGKNASLGEMFRELHTSGVRYPTGSPRQNRSGLPRSMAERSQEASHEDQLLSPSR